MTKNPMAGETKWLRFPLALKLTLVIAAVVLATAFFLVGYLGPETRQSFIERSDGLISLSRAALDEMVRRNITESTDLLVRLNEYTTEQRRLHMQDLPLSLYRNDADRIRGAIASADAAMSSGFHDKVAILAEEMERRRLREVNQRLESLTSEQETLGTSFASDIRRAFLILSGGVFMALFLMLGLGLYRTVIRPVRQLRRGTQGVAAGNLDVEVQFHSGDEIGDLSADFAAMVRQLRQSREEIRDKNLALEELNRNLEAEVTRKTSHLEQALDDLRRAQRQLIHAEKMASIGTLAGGIAHEFNNLIGGIRGCAGEVLEAETAESRREIVDVIRRAADRAGEITEQLLRFSRRRDIEMRPAEVTRLLDEALALVEPDARRRNVAVTKSISPAEPFPADGAALHQVFLNLFTNALQAMPGGGELAVEAGKESGHLVIRVRDTGVGIAPDHVSRIFEPFFTTKDQDPDPALRGSGLGLSVSYSIVEAHGGTLEVESREGEGSLFTLRLPAAERPPGDAAGDEDTTDGRGRDDER